jgi:hypothetical protein
VALTIVRFGWVKRVVLERDRFASLLAARLCEEHPHLSKQKAQLVSEVLCDAIMGVVMGELWRERDEASAKAMRAEVRALVVREVEALVRGP